ncbi:hypothetical protein KBY27_11050 [Ruegeria pomeroyi]|uniref:Uncharacterized protein n=1 Tax=Ruegeria pomeroyi TaxID=89184 RepID=A0A9Q3ZPD9_9RHOB|nr:hypothetical protein [Ruegeria pomeroyi]MCE8537992.1 hypothetical protein [Ruegeria pomeroyi]
MAELDGADMFTMDDALGCHHQPIRTNPLADRAIEDVEAGSIVRIVDAGRMMDMGDLARTSGISDLATDAGDHLQRIASRLREDR